MGYLLLCYRSEWLWHAFAEVKIIYEAIFRLLRGEAFFFIKIRSNTQPQKFLGGCIAVRCNRKVMQSFSNQRTQ